MNKLLQLQLPNRSISTELPAFIMGILNATPDSFFPNSRGGFKRAKELILQGADIIDIGGESTKPGNIYISEDEELKRVIPLIKSIRAFSTIPISVDTRKLAVIKEAVKYGADILNDISALEDDPLIAKWCGENKIPVIIMHKKGNPLTMQQNATYKNVINEVDSYFQQRITYAKQNGISEENIILDPGIGFSKNLDNNIKLIKECGKLGKGKYKILMGLSRKTCIGEITGNPVKERLAGTLAANLLAVQNGATILRVHDVKETLDTLKVLQFISENSVDHI